MPQGSGRWTEGRTQLSEQSKQQPPCLVVGMNLCDWNFLNGGKSGLT